MAYNNNIPPTLYTCHDEEGRPFWCDVENFSLPGFLYFPEYVDKSTEKRILDLMDTKEWNGGIGRRTQHYGYTYYHTKHDLLDLQPEVQPETEPLTSLDFFTKNIEHFFPDAHPPTQCLVNEYVNNRGISSHVDNPNCFGDVVVGLSLCNPVYMTFQLDETADLKIEIGEHKAKEAKIFLARRSLMVMKDEVRFQWKHAITAMKRIYIPETGTCIHRKSEYRRVSLTYREIKVPGTKQVIQSGIPANAAWV